MKAGRFRRDSSARFRQGFCAAAALGCSLLSFSCGGGGDSAPGAPTAPLPSPTATVRGSVTATVLGGPVRGASFVTDGSVVGGSAADGSFGLELPDGIHEVTVTAPGFVERTTRLRSPATGVALDLIPEDSPWTLEFYRELARNGAGGGDLEPLIRWDSEPTFYIDTRPEPTTGAEIPAEAVAFVREAIAVSVSLLSDGRFTGERVHATDTPPPDLTPGTVVLRWNAAEVAERAQNANAFAFRVGGPSNVVVFRHLDETWAVHHEIGHVMGLYHPLGGYRPSHMWYSGELQPPHFTEWDLFHARVLYSRPAGNRDIDRDPAGFVLGSELAVAGQAEPAGPPAPVVCVLPEPS